MALTEEQKKKVGEWLDIRKKTNAVCPSCSLNNWDFGDVISAPVYTPGGIAMGVSTVPMVQVICNNCAFIRLFAAVPIGIT